MRKHYKWQYKTILDLNFIDLFVRNGLEGGTSSLKIRIEYENERRI